MTISVRYGQKSASTTVHQFDDASLKRAIAEAQTLAKQRPDNPELMPLLKPPQDYVEVEAALPAAVNFGPPSAPGWSSRASTSAKSAASSAPAIPKIHWTDARANSEGLFAYHRYAEASLILTCRTPDGTGSGWAGTTGLKDVTKIDAVGISETASQKALASRKARAIEPGTYCDSRAASGGALPVAAPRVAQRASGGRGRSFMSGASSVRPKWGRRCLATT